MLLFQVLVAAFAFLASTVALNLPALAFPSKRSTTIHSTKISTTALERQAKREFRLLQLKYSEKIDIRSKQRKEEDEGGMMKRVVKAIVTPPVVSQRQVGLTPLTPNNRMIGWSASYQIFKGNALKLLFDSGSSLTIVNRDAYTPSPLALDTGYVVTTTYMDGTHGSGNVILDYISIGGLTLRTTLVWASENIINSAFGVDGILGVGFTDSQSAASLVEAMVQNFTMLNDVICMTMTNTGDGALQFGALDANIVNEIQYTDTLTQAGHAWDTRVSINGVGPFNSVIDTGTTFTWLPIKMARQLFNELKLPIYQAEGSGQQEGELYARYPCRQGPPEIKFVIGDISIPFTLAPKTLDAWTFDDCRLSIIGSPQLKDTDDAIIGANFLKNVHFVMDRGLYKLGFAQRILAPEEQGLP